MIDGFGSLGAVLAAPRRRLLRVTGDDVAAVQLVCAFRRTMMHVLRTRVANRPTSLRDVIDYLSVDLVHSPVERVRVLFFDGRQQLIRDELFGIGTIDSATVPIQEVMRRALDLGAASIVLAHNHPGGDPAPSHADIHTTRKLARAAEAIEVHLYDHLIVSANGHTSFRALGLL